MNGSIGYKDNRVGELIDENNHLTYVFPSVSNLTCTLAASATPNVTSAWAEIADSGATTLSSKFATYEGHITGIDIFSCDVADKMYICDIAYGSAKTVITSFSFISNATGKKVVPKLIRVRALHIPAGETVYYRMMCETASKVLTVDFRYFLYS